LYVILPGADDMMIAIVTGGAINISKSAAQAAA
jgi:hypothetical protein